MDAKVVALLLRLGANCEARTRDGRTPLIHAARRGLAAIVQQLVEHGAQKNGASSLLYHKPCSNADPAHDNVGYTAFLSALLCGNSTVLAMLRPQGDINASARNGLRFADVFAQVYSLQGMHLIDILDKAIDASIRFETSENAGRSVS